MELALSNLGRIISSSLAESHAHGSSNVSGVPCTQFTAVLWLNRNKFSAQTKGLESIRWILEAIAHLSFAAVAATVMSTFSRRLCVCEISWLLKLEIWPGKLVVLL